MTNSRIDFHLQMAKIKPTEVTAPSGTVISLSRNGVALAENTFHYFGEYNPSQLGSLYLYQTVESLLKDGDEVFAYTVPVGSGFYSGLFPLRDYGKTHLHRGGWKLSATVVSTEFNEERQSLTIEIEDDGVSYFTHLTASETSVYGWRRDEIDCLLSLLIPGKTVDVLATQADRDSVDGIHIYSMLIEADDGYVLVGTGDFACCMILPERTKSFLWVQRNKASDVCICGIPSEHIDVLHQATHLNGLAEQAACWNCNAMQLGNTRAYGPSKADIEAGFPDGDTPWYLLEFN